MSNKIDVKEFRVRPGKKVDLQKWPTVVKPFFESKKEYEKLLGEHVEALGSLQRLHYASNRYALLLILQGMDAAGKDGAVRHVMSGFNPQDCWAHSFKQPSSEELEHDFLWRTTRRLPERGQIGIFNRSYYEEVLIVRVHPENLLNEGLSEELRDNKKIWEERFRSMVDLERHLYRNGTRTVKIFLHLSKEEQRKRFLERIDEPDKNWKLARGHTYGVRGGRLGVALGLWAWWSCSKLSWPRCPPREVGSNVKNRSLTVAAQSRSRLSQMVAAWSDGRGSVAT
jgi:PPK2 family polyphosphate:nucleotide phosphotransferase